MKKFTLLFSLMVFLIGSISAQRYLTEVFDNVTVTEDQTYGANATVIALSIYGEAVPQPLKMDVYQPEGDTETDRPLIILLPTGNFLPPDVNGGCTGTRKDAINVEVATRLAKMGYVVASADYRIGWNPVDPVQTNRVYTLINAAYRGVQDSRTCIRYFRKTAALAGNPWGINPDKIVKWGIGTGGYISFASSTLDTITDTWIPKFFAGSTPMVVEQINGNPDGTTVGIVPPGYPGFPAGDTLCYPTQEWTHAGFRSDFNLAVNMGGALGDTSWIDANDPPVISFAVPTDPFAPCGIGIVLVPPPVNLPVVEVMGSCSAQPIMNRYGLNSCFANLGLTDPYTTRANELNDGSEGFFPFVSSDPTEGSPWDFASSLSPYGIAGVPDCDTTYSTSAPYIDSIMNYYAPRAFACLDLTTDVNDVYQASEIGLKYSPNPAVERVAFETESAFPIEELYLYDVNGKFVFSKHDINSSSFNLNRGNMPSGMYFVRLKFADGIVNAKIIFN